MFRHSSRLPRAAQILLREISDNSPLCASYDALAARIGYDPDTVRVAVHFLVERGKISKARGYGRIPNRYEVRRVAVQYRLI